MSTDKTVTTVEEHVTFLLRFRWVICFALAVLILWIGLLAQKVTEFEEVSYSAQDKFFEADTYLFNNAQRVQTLTDDLYSKQRDTKAVLQKLSETVSETSSNFALSVADLREQQQTNFLYTATTFGELHQQMSAEDALAEARLKLVVKALTVRIIVAEGSLLEAQTVLAEYRTNFDEITQVLSSFRRAAENNAVEKPPEMRHSFCGDNSTVCSIWTMGKEQ
jgi:hypothetical protein